MQCFSYGLWRTLVGLSEEVEFSLMEAGHTKISLDWHFGIWKVNNFVNMYIVLTLRVNLKVLFQLINRSVRFI